jgi:hypothetical protein
MAVPYEPPGLADLARMAMNAPGPPDRHADRQLFLRHGAKVKRTLPNGTSYDRDSVDLTRRCSDPR